MPLLNPYLRAFFRSALPAQCTPVGDHILLVPTTEILIGTRDRESGALYTDLAGSDEFLGSHVLRVPSGSTALACVGGRENRGKARQFTTFNGRTVVVKDSWIYSNKGFRSLNQAQLLNDVLYYPDTNEPQQWLVYFISRPLIGSLEQILTILPQLRDRTSTQTEIPPRSNGSSRKKDIRSFNELLIIFPMIARQMQPGLEKLFQDFEISFEKFKPLPRSPISSSSQSVRSGISSRASTHSSVNGDIYKQQADESEIRKSLEAAINSAVDLFQRVDQSQLNLLASSTDLTGPAVDRLIERYVAEQLHDSILFPRICATKNIEDEELEQKIVDMENVDLTQVGIPSLDLQEKTSLVQRLTRGIEAFEKIGKEKSPQAMMEALLETAKSLTRLDEEVLDTNNPTASAKNPEKTTMVTMNADMLVSLLLIVVIRAKVPNLHASLSYMRNFIFVEDVEQGETGYILSTLEAVLFHIAQDHTLSAASKANEKLWRSVRNGDFEGVKKMLAQDDTVEINGMEDEEEEGEDEDIEMTTSIEIPRSIGERDEASAGSNIMSVHNDEGEESSHQSENGSGDAKVEDVATNGISPSQVDTMQEEASQNMKETGAENQETEKQNKIVGDDKLRSESSLPELPDNLAGSSHNNGSEDNDDLSNGTPDAHVDPSLSWGGQNSVAEGEGVDETRATNGISLVVDDFDATDDSSLYTDSILSAATASSSLATGISNIRLEDVRTDGQDDDSLSSILRPTALKVGPSTSRAGITRFEVEEETPSSKFRRKKSNVGSTTTSGAIDETLSLRKISSTHTSQSQILDAFSIDKISKTRNAQGESVLMMAIQERRVDILQYLLETSFYDIDFLLEDTNNEGTTLLSAAVQLENMELVEVLLKYLLNLQDEKLMKYLDKPDNAGRTVAHYLFNTPDLIARLGRWLPWKSKDKNGQTPVFALCRSYDHARYREMVGMCIKCAQASQDDDSKLHLDEHVDGKGNTLLHIAGDPVVLRTLLKCDADVNAVNEKGFTALMVASKYGRLEMVRTMFGDPRVDLLTKELRGLTAVELAKDDNVRNRIDDLVLFQNEPTENGRVTAVVRSFFVEDATIRVVVKSGAPSSESTFTITTCRRSLTDFQFLAEWLEFENPGSWLPALNITRTPYQIPSKPSRSVLRDIQLRLDNFLRTLLLHSTFSTHELLWEFFLVPELQPELMIERSKKKAELRVERIKEEFSPVEDTRDVEVFVSYAKDSVRSINYGCRSVTRRATVVRSSMSDLSDAFKLGVKHLSGFKFLHETSHIASLHKFAETLMPTESNPYALFLEDFRNIQSSLNGVMTALERPRHIINQMSTLQKQIDRHVISLRRSDKWPLGILDDTRAKIHQEAAEKVAKTKEEYSTLSSELRYTQTVAAAELASFHDLHEKQTIRAIRALARRQVVAEKAKLEAMKRAIRGISSKTATQAVHK